MKVAIISDIHGNLRALEAVRNDLRQVAPDITLHGGDLALGSAHTAEVIDQVRSLGWPGVCGNTDEALWSQERLAEMAAANPKFVPVFTALQQMIEATRAQIGEERLRWLKGLPSSMHREEGLSLVHASPGDCWRSPLPGASDDELQKTYGPLGTSTVVYGHIHQPYIRRLGSLTVANTGSVSQSYDGDRRASYLVIEGQSLTIRRVEYDVEAEARELMQSGLPHAAWTARILLAGRYCPLELSTTEV